MCKENCENCSCENDSKNDVNLISVEDCEDGSSIVTIELSEKMRDFLLEKGFNTILKEYIDEQLKEEN